MSALPPPSSTGVLIAGYQYQWLLVWRGCVTALRDAGRRTANPVLAVGVEVDDAGNLDDLVLYRAAPPHTYGQVKYAVDSTSPVNEAYLLDPSKRGGPSILRKMAETWRRLIDDGSPVDLRFISNRTIDPSDPLLSARDARTGLLLPKAAVGGPRSEAGKARARWGHNAGVTEEELLRLLDVLHFEVGIDPQHLRELVSLQMLAAGLRDDDNAIHAAADWVARQVRDGYRNLGLDSIISAVDDLELTAHGPARAVLSVATLKPDPLAGHADYALDWVDQFDGASEFLKRRPRPPAAWSQLQADIEAIPAHLPKDTSAVALTGSLRQATAFAVGAALRQVTGVNDLAVKQRDQLWSSNEKYDAPMMPAVAEHHLGQGDELAVAVAVATDPSEDILEFLKAEAIPVDRLVVLRPLHGAKDNAIPDATAAVALAVGIRDTVRRASRRCPRVHLFLVGSMALAALLGHRWNRVRPTTIYEDVQGRNIYEAAFTVDA